MKSNYTYSEQLKRINKIIQWGNYQLFITVTIFAMLIVGVSSLFIIPIMEVQPKFSHNGKLITNVKEFCNTTYPNLSLAELASIEIDPSSVFNWAYAFKLVCSPDETIEFIGIFYFLGSVVSSIVLSHISDMYGRRKVIIICSTLMFFSVVQLFYLKSLYQLLIFCVTTGICSIIIPTSLVMMSESINERDSGLSMSIGYCSYPLVGVINALIMYFMQDWRYFLILLTFISFTSTLLSFFFLKESPKWLLANKYEDELNDSLIFIAKMNGISENDLNSSICHDTSNHNTNPNSNSYSKAEVKDPRFEKKGYSYTILDLFIHKSLRGNTIKCCIVYISTSFGFYGLFLNLNGLVNDIYLNAIVTFSGEVIANILGGIALYYIGRKSLVFYGCLFSTIFFILYYVTGIFSDVAQMIILFLCAFSIGSVYTAITVYSPEIYPTNTKSLSMTFYTAVTRLAGSSVFLILTFTKQINVISIVLLAISTIVATTMPETSGYDPGHEIQEVMREKTKIHNEGDIEAVEEFISRC